MTRWNGQVFSGLQGGVTVIWASPSHITLAIWVRVRVTGDAHITRGLGMGTPLSL